MCPAGSPHHAAYHSYNYHLPPPGHDLDITSLISIIMALIALTVIWENVTSLMRGARFWEKWENTKYPENTNNVRTASREQDMAEKNVRDRIG